MPFGREVVRRMTPPQRPIRDLRVKPQNVAEENLILKFLSANRTAESVSWKEFGSWGELEAYSDEAEFGQNLGRIHQRIWGACDFPIVTIVISRTHLSSQMRLRSRKTATYIIVYGDERPSVS